MTSNQQKRRGGGCLTVIVILIIVAVISASGSQKSGPSASSARPQVCLPNAPGGKLCGGDAKSFCQEMQQGQTVDASSVDAPTRKACGELGVYLR